MAKNYTRKQHKSIRIAKETTKYQEIQEELYRQELIQFKPETHYRTWTSWQENGRLNYLVILHEGNYKNVSH